MRAALTVIFIIVLVPGCSRGNQQKQWAYVHHSAPLTKAKKLKSLTQYQVICITGFKISARGSLLMPGLRELKRFINIKGKGTTRIYPLISFLSVRDGIRFLHSTSAQRTATAALHRLLNKYRLRGLHLDFEYLPPSFAEKCAPFIKFLKKNMHGATLSMALFPQVNFPKQWSAFHNLQLLSPHLDQVVIMCYDLHRPCTRPGPVTDIQWSQKNIRIFLKYFSPKQIWLGIPAYGYYWKKSGCAVVLSEKTAMLMKNRCTFKRHKSGTVFLRCGKSIKGWYSDYQTRRLLQKTARTFNLRGTALWRLGFEKDNLR